MFAVAAAPVLGLRALPARRVQSRRCAAAKVVRASQQPFAAKAEAKVAGAAVAGSSFALFAQDASAAVASMPREVAQLAELEIPTPVFYIGFLGLFIGIAVVLFIGLSKIKLI